LKTAHAIGIIHRDLKPANVILRDGTHVIVVDFGMSKIVTGMGTGNTTNLTTHNMVFGTPEYMSPEQARGDELDARCDVYAAGVMLYEMVTGEQPFTGTTPLSVLTAHLTSDLVPPSRRAAPGRLTPALESVIVHALSRDRDRRYPSAAALSAALMHARVAPDDVASLKPEAFAAQPPGTDAFAATIPSIGPVKPDPSVPPPIVKRETSPPSTKKSARVSSKPPPPPEDNRTWILLWVLVGLLSIGAGVYFALRR
jgi:serine/threonine-protein kinase